NQSHPANPHGDALGIYIAQGRQVGFDFEKRTAHGLTLHWLGDHRRRSGHYARIAAFDGTLEIHSLLEDLRFFRLDSIASYHHRIGPIRDSPTPNGKSRLVARLLNDVADGLVMQSIGVRERFDPNAKIFLEQFLGTDDFAFQPGEI